MLEIVRVSNRLGLKRYWVRTTPPHTKVAYKSSRPLLGRWSVQSRLLRLGAHPVDIDDALLAADETWQEAAVQRRDQATSVGVSPWAATFDQYQQVRFLDDHPAEGVARGMVGWIIEIHKDPGAPDGDAYEVEVMDDAGHTTALLVVRASEIDAIERHVE